MASLFSWVFFFALITVMIVIDLGLVHRKERPFTLQTAMVWSCVWIGLAFAFCAYIYEAQGSKQALDFLTGYLIEKTLSLDNLLVFIVIFTTFQLTIEDQHRVLLWGILGAIILRGVFIAFGTALVSQFHWLLYALGLFLLFTAFKMIRQKGSPLNFTQTWIYQICQKVLPISRDVHHNAFIVVERGKYAVTSLFLALVSIEFFDLIFAIDSIPAIFAITLDPFIVYTSNIFAILGLRAHYFLLQKATQKYEYITDSLAYILVFAGIKMLIQDVIEIPALLSLMIILGIIGACYLVRRYKIAVFHNKN